MTGDPAVFEKHSKGRVIEPMESILRTTFTEILPTDIQYALTVPIYNIDKRPFALICAYNLDKKDNIRYVRVRLIGQAKFGLTHYSWRGMNSRSFALSASSS